MILTVTRCHFVKVVIADISTTCVVIEALIPDIDIDILINIASRIQYICLNIKISKIGPN